MLFKTKEPKEQKIVYEIKAINVPLPKEGEMVIFQIPANMPKVVVHEIESRLAEAINLDRRYLLVASDINIRVINKEEKMTVEVEDESNNRTSDPKTQK